MALNRIYKVVWSKTKGCYVVVSELAKRVGRNKAKAIVISSAAVAMAVIPVVTSTVGAAPNQAGTGPDNSVVWGQDTKVEKNNGVAIGKGAKSTEDSAIALGFQSKSSGNWSVAIGLQTNATNKQAVAVGSKSQATGENSIAIGNAANASNESSVALGSSTQSTNKYTTAVGGTAFATQEGATALGYGARATAKNTIAIGNSTKAEQEGVLALGAQAYAKAADTIAIGNSATAKQVGDIIIGKDAKSRDQGAGRSVAIGFKASAGSNRSNYEKDDASTGQRGDDGSVAIGTNAYTGLNRTNAAVNSSVAIGAGAGVGYRSVGADGKPLGVGTDADDNDKVLVKAFGGTTSTLGNYNNAGAASNPGFFSFQGVDINEGVALGRNTRAMGDQSVAIGAQSVAGMGSIVIGGNDIQAYDGKKYFKAANPTSGPANTVNDYDAPTTPGTGKDGQPITISKKYEELVGAGLDRSWRASYGQDGSTVIGMQAHSTTPLGVAIGTNSIVRKGAFGATAIGSGASVVANAEAAVAIGMGSEAQGNYAVAAGTAARAAESAVAVGYSATATNASVAVGQLAKATKVADIAVGQGAVASGEQGAIAMGLGTQAQGHSSIMIGGSEITEVAAQKVNYQKEKIDADGKTVIKSTKKTETIGGEQVERTIRSVEMENTMGTIQQAYGELTNGDILNTTRLDYSSATNRNGHGSISMGIHSLSTGDLGTAIGTGARVTKLGGVALGTGAISELQNGVAIGTGSRADSRSIGTRQTDISYDEEGHIVPFDSKKVAYTFYWAGGSNTSEGDVVSFGSPGAERQLKNVAAGRIADDSTDAINGSQLNSVTKRMSNGWSVEAEKDKTSSGVLKLNGALATKGTEVHSANGKTTTRENPGTATGNVDKIRLNDEVKIRVGDNLVLHQEDASRPVYEDPDDPTRQTGTRVTSKFTYSLNPELTGLKSAQFKNDAGDTTDINGAGVTVTPVTAGKQPVSLTTAGLNNGGNAISNVAGNLPSTKNNDATTGASNATTSQAAPTLGNAANQVNPTNAATVSDVLNAGWNLQGNNKAVDFVKPYDTVNFVNGDGTTATVESADGKTSTVKYSVNLGDGLKKDDATNKITVTAADKSLTVGTDGVKVNPGDKSLKTTDAGLTVNTADKSLEVTDAGLKVKAGDKTLTTDEKGLKVNTGEIESVTTGANPGTVKVKDGDNGKVATVDSVVNAVNSAAFTLKASANGGTRNASSGVTTDGESIKAGSTIEMIAGKNLDVKHDASGKITFATVENPSFNTMQVGGDQGPKLSKTNDGDLKVSGSNGTDPVKVTNVKSGLDTYGGNVAGTTDKNTGLVDLSKPTAGEPKVSDNTAATVGDIRNMGWIVSSNKTTGADGAVTATEYSGTVKNANEVRFVGTGSAIVSGKTDGNVRTITVKVDDQTSSNNAVTPVVYTDKDGNRVYPTGETDKDGNQIFNTKPDGKGNAVTGPVKTTVNGPKGTSAPTTLSNVEGNLVGAKTGTDAPTTSATAPTLGTGTDQVNKNNAATVGDVLNAGWNLQNNDAAKDFVKPYDTVNFVDGEGTTAVVETTTDQATSKIKYNVNTGKGLEKTTDNKITVKPGDKSLEVTDAGVAVKKADQSLEVTDDGLKVKTDNKTITTGKDGLTVNTGTVNAVEQGDKKGTVEVPTADAGKIATVDTVAKAVNNAAFTLKASANGGTRNAGSGVTADGESIKAGSTIEMIAGKNLDVKHDASGKITFATIESPSFNTIQVGGDQGPKLSKTDDGNIKVSDKDGTNPVNITNVKSNLPDTQNSDTTNTATNPSNATTSKAAPNTTNKTGDSYINPNNAATVSDVLNAGWNLQGNGSAVDFVKPYDTVNFVNGVNTTAVVSTVDGKTSNVTYNVTGLPITYTDKDGNLVSKIGDEFYKVNDKGQPLDAKGNPSTKVNKDGKPVDDAGNVIDPINTTNNPVKTSLVNPAPEANKTGTTSPTTLDNVTSKLENYKADPVNGKEPAKNSLRDLTNTNVTDNTVATVGDIRNMGWIVSSDKTTGANGTTTATEYSEAVKNANEVRFVGEGSAIVSGKTDDKGVRTITVKVDNQTGINKTVTPVNYTKADGTKVYPQEVDNGDGTKTVKFFENPDGTGKEIPSTEVITSVNGPKGTTTPSTLSNLKSNLPDTKNSDTANTADAPSNATKSQAAPNTTNKDGDKYINPNNAATVSDVLNAGWNLQGNGTEVDFVKPYDTVNFVNGLNTTAVVSTVDGKTSNVTYNVTGLPVTYTTEDGTPVTKIGDKYYKVNDQGQPVDGTGAPVTKFNKDGKPLDKDGHEVPDVNITDKPLKTSLVNPAPETNKTGTTSPTSLSNVKNNIPTVNDEDKTAHKADGTAIGGKNNTEAPITAGDAANLLKPIVNGAPNPNFVGNNAATVSDVLNAGWNLQNNGAAKDFVKPYDTVNFVNGGNTTAVVTTNAAGTASDVTFNVTGLPVTYTTEDGSPVSKVGDKYYKVNDKGQPISDAGKPAVGTNNDGKLVDENNNVIEPIDTTKPLKTALVNPTPAGDKPNTTTATQLGNVTSGLDKYGDQVNNADVPGTTDKNRGLVDLSKPANGDAPKVSDNTAATVGDLRNMGWIVSSNKTTGENGAVTTDEYSATVKNANEVKFVGEGTAVVSGKTDDKGVRTITVKVDDQTSTNKSVTPVVYTDEKGNQVYPTGKTDTDGNQIFNTKPDGKGEDVTGPVKTTINGPKGTTSPASLSNVKNNIPAVNDADKKVTNPDGTNKPDAGNVANINKAPLTAEEAADLLKPTTKDGKSNPNFVGNNAATVSDVLNTGWNLQNNGTAKDFVKPYDTVNFVNGLNTTAVVTTSDDGTTSNVTYNVTGLPVTYTTADGTPVSKIGDKFYKVNDKGQPVDEQGNPSTKVNNNGEPIDGNGNVINPINTAANPLKTSLVNPTPETNKTGTTSPTTLDNVTSKLTNYSDPEVNGKAPVRNNLVDLSKPEQGEPNVSDNTVATVGDLRNMGWIVSSDKTTGELTKDYSDTVKNANEVKFVGEGTAVVSGKTDDKGVRTITVKVDDQTSTNNAVTPVMYTDKDGKQVYPTGKTDKDGNQIFNTKPDGKGEDVTGPVKTTINGPKGSTSPTSLSNVKNNIPAVNDADKKVTNPDGTNKQDAGNVANINKAPLTAEEAADLLKPTTKDGKSNPNFVGNNAATVSDVLNAGWNLQNNGTAKDFVKPYDTVNFVNGGNTTAVVTTNAEGTVSDVTFNVTGLPVTNTITENGKEVPVVKVGNTFYPAKPDGTPDIQKGQDGNPTNGYVQADNGKVYPRDAVTITKNQDGTTTVTPNTDATPKTVNTNLVNPNVANTTDKPGNNVSTPNQLGNVANGAKTFEPVDGKVLANDGKWYPADKVSDKGTPEAGAKAVENPLAPKNATGEPLVQAKDGKWYKPSDLQPNGTPTPTAQPQDNVINNKAGLVDFSNSNPNNAATIGDLQNMGWVVSAQGNSYSDQVRNTNEVKFVGEGTASVTGKTDDKGVRTITVKVDDQVSTNNSVTPVIYTDKAGNTVYPIKDDKGNVTYHTTPDGKGENDKVVPNGDVNTSINGPKDDQGNTRPASLSNVKNNIPAVNDADKKVTNPDGTDKPDTGNVANINKAPLTAEEAADLLKPTTKDGKPNPNFVGNNAATVSDVLNAGWNLQNNGTAKDFVKSFDTVNFVNGGNTTAVVTTNAEGTASDVTFNVTGLPIATTIATPNGPVQLTKVGDNYYPVNADGTPNIQKDGDNNPTNGYVKADNGNYYPAGDVTFGKDPVTNVTTVTPKDGKQPVTFGNSLTNPNVVNTTDAPNKAVAAPTTLNNVKGNLPTVNDADKTAHDVDGAPIADKNNTAAPITAKDAANLLNPYKVDKDGNYLDANGNITTDPAQRVANPNFAGNNAATVSDVLNAGWNLTGNGAAVDLVKPYDTVNFRNGGNTTVSVTTDDNLTSHVQVNVTGLPVSNTITDPTTGKQVPVVKVGDSFYPVNPDGTPKIERGQDGNPTNGYVRANDGKLYPREDVNVTPAADPAQPPTITPKDGKTPTTVNTNLVNPNVDNTTDNPGNNVSTPNQLGNVANGAKTFDSVAADGTKLVQVGDKFYPEDKVKNGVLKPDATEADAKDPVKLANDGKWYKASDVKPNGAPKTAQENNGTEPKPVANPLAPKNVDGDVLEKGNDGKWYKANELTNGKPNNGAIVQQPVAKPANSEKSGLIDFTNSNPNNAATIGDLQNMGWVVSAEGNSYSDQVRNANEVKFVGEGTAIVSGKTDDKGVRTITVKVDDQTSTNNSVTPVNYTKADGTKVYPKMVTNPDTGKEELKFFENPDGSGAEVPKGDVVTSINGPEGTTSPTTLKNVKNNIPAVDDADKKVTNPDGTDKPDAGNVANINKAPLTAEEAADLLKPTTKDGKPNPNFVGNNAATVSDVLNAGWNLQNNGVARDFVKPFDTVNFVNGVNTTAVVTTSEDGTTSNVTYNVTGLPVTYTTADGTPVSKIGDDYYTVNDKGQPIDANGKPSTKVNKDGKPVDENGNVIKPIDTTANPLTSSLVNPNVKNTEAEPNKKTTDPTQLGNVTSGLHKYGDTVDGKEVPGSTKANNGLVDLSTPTDGSKPKVSDNTAATVGDLRNMGWIVSSDKTTGETDKAYTDTVKNANEVKFVGEGTAIVSGKTDGNVRTITVKVDDQTSTNNSVTPVNYTKADGTKVYPKAVRDPKTGKEEVKFFENPDGSGAEVPKGDVVTSINGPEGTTSPTTLKNVKNNIPNVNDGSKTITNPDGTEKIGDVENINKAPLTAEEAAALANPKTKDGQANPKYIGNNAATVSDVLNAGWNLQNNGESRDFVKPYDTVNFVNGLGTTAVVTTREDNTASDVTFNVKAANGSVTVDENGVKVTTGEMKPAVGTDNKETGAIATPADPATAKQLKETLAAAEKDLSAAREALKEAEKALAADPKDPALQQAVADKKADVAAKQTPVNEAQKAHDEAGLNKIATVQNVAEAINNAGFNLKTSADGGEKLTGTKDDGELIQPSYTVEMVAGNNLTVKQDANGKITYATKDNVTFTNVDTGTLNVGSPNTYTDGKGNTYTKVGDKYYKPADVVNGAPKPGTTPVDVTTTPVTPVSPVTMKAEAAKPATNNPSDAQPSSALNVTSKDGKPTQITGVGSTLNTKTVDTTPAGTAPGATPNTTPANLVDLEGTADAPVNKNAAATVGDLQNMGWVVSAKDGNGYKDVVKNANVVDFKGGNGIEITGKTLTDGTREITVGIKEGEVTNKVTITHTDGSKTDAIKIGDNYYKVGKDGKPEGYEKGKDGKPAGTPLTVDPKNDKVTNTGAGFVTGNTVANAIQESGWNVGIGSTDKDYSKDAKVYDKVNPNDDVKFANGANTNVSMVTVDAINEDGTKKATTYVKVDVNRDLKIDSVTTGGTATDKNGNNLVKVGDKYYKEGDVTVVTNPDGSTTVTPKKDAKPVPPADVIPAKDGAMIVKNADGKDVVSATVGKDGSGVFGVNGKDGKDGVSITAKDGEGAIGVNGKDGATTTIKGDTITLTDKDKNTNTSTPTTNVLKDTNGNTNASTAANTELKDKAGNTNTSTSTTVTLADKDKNTNTSTAAGTTYKDKDDNKTVVGPKEINISDKSGENTASLTNKDLLLNAKDPNTGVDKTSHVSGDKIAFSTTDEMEKVVDKDGKPVIDPATGKQKEVVKMEKVFDKDGKPVIDPATGKQKEVVKNPGNSTEYTNEGLKVIPNSTVARDVNGNPTFLDKNGKPVMKDTDGKYKYVGQDGKPGEKYTDAVGSLKPNVVDNTRVISFGMDKPVLDKNGKPVTGPDGNPIMTEGISAGMQQMHNLAPGTKDTDAVNVSQLRGTTININNRMNRMGAQAAALAGLQSIQYDPLEPTQISAGLGYYKGSSALALGINHYKNESTMFHMGASLNGHGDETMMNASVTWKFGARADETAVKDTFRQGPISASYTLQDKVSALEAQNKIQKDQLNELRTTNAAQKAENEAQREELALMKAQIAELFKRING